MSIIEEALRRVQEPLLPPAKKPAVSPPPQAAPQAARPAPAHSWEAAPALSVPSPSPLQSQTTLLTAVAVAVLALTVALVIGGAFWMGRAVAPASQSFAPPPSAPSATAQPQSASAPVNIEPPARTEMPRAAKKSGPPPDLVLSGIVEGLGEPYAVINGLIIGKGERVANATLEEIANGSVTLRHDNGQKTILRVPR